MKWKFKYNRNIKYLKFIVENVFSKKIQLDVLEGRLLLLLIFWNDANAGISDENTVAEALNKMYGIESKNSVLWNDSFRSLFISKTIKISGDNRNVYDTLLRDVEVNHEIIDEVKKENFYKLSKDVEKIKTKANLYQLNGFYVQLDELGSGVSNSSKIDSKSSDEFKTEEIQAIKDKCLPMLNNEFQLVEQNLEAIDVVEAILQLEFEFDGNELKPATNAKTNDFDVVTNAFIKALENTELESLIESISFENNLNFDEIEFNEDVELVLDADEAKSFVNPTNAQKIGNDLFIKNGYAYKAFCVKTKIIVKNEKFDASFLAIDKFTDDEFIELLIENNNYLNIFELSKAQKKQILGHILRENKLSTDKIEWIYKSSILSMLSPREIIDFNNVDLIKILPEKELRKVLKDDKNKELKPFLHVLANSMDPMEIYSYFNSFEEAKESKLLDNVEEFNYFIRLNEKLESINIDKTTVQKETLEELVVEIERLSKLSSPFKSSQTNVVISMLKELEKTLFMPSKEELISRGILLRMKLEEEICLMLGVPSIPVGEFAKFVKKVSILNKKQHEKIIKAYKLVNEWLLHYEADKKAELDSKKIIKFNDQFNRVEEEIKNVFN